MTESKIALTERLRAEGRWEKASRFKDEKIAELRQSGIARKNASAWEAMAEKYPPLPAELQRVNVTYLSCRTTTPRRSLPEPTAKR